MSEPVPPAALLEPDLAQLSRHDLAARRAAIVHDLAQHLTSGTAGQLAARGRRPVVEISHRYASEAQLEGTLLQAEIHTVNADIIEVRVPGEARPRRHTPGETLYFHARHDGCIDVLAYNVLNPKPTRASSMPIFVLELDRFTPDPLRDLTINGLTHEDVAELSTAMAAARAAGLELDPWAAGRAVLEIQEDLQQAARDDLAAIDDLTAAMSESVRELGETVARQAEGSRETSTIPFDAAREAQSFAAGAVAPHPVELRAPFGDRLLRDARAAVELVLRQGHQPTLDDLRAAAEPRR